MRPWFGGAAYWGEVTEVRQLTSPTQPGGDTTLWHVAYEDGDEEELNELEARRAAEDAAQARRSHEQATTAPEPGEERGRRCASCGGAGDTEHNPLLTCVGCAAVEHLACACAPSGARERGEWRCEGCHLGGGGACGRGGRPAEARGRRGAAASPYTNTARRIREARLQGRRLRGEGYHFVLSLVLFSTWPRTHSTWNSSVPSIRCCSAASSLLPEARPRFAPPSL